MSQTTPYVVQAGDSLSRIASKFGIPDWKTIYYDASNTGFRHARPNPNQIFPGDKINIPSPGGVGAHASDDSPPVKSTPTAMPPIPSLSLPGPRVAECPTAWVQNEQMYLWLRSCPQTAKIRRETAAMIARGYRTCQPWLINTGMLEAIEETRKSQASSGGTVQAVKNYLKGLGIVFDTPGPHPNTPDPPPESKTLPLPSPPRPPGWPEPLPTEIKTPSIKLPGPFQ